MVLNLMPGIKRKLCTCAEQDKTKRNSKRLIVIAAAVVAALSLTTTAVASFGVFDWFKEKTDPDYSELLYPVETNSSIYDGVKLSAVAAANADDTAIIYLMLEDTEGCGRVQADT